MQRQALSSAAVRLIRHWRQIMVINTTSWRKSIQEMWWPAIAVMRCVNGVEYALSIYFGCTLYFSYERSLFSYNIAIHPVEGSLRLSTGIKNYAQVMGYTSSFLTNFRLLHFWQNNFNIQSVAKYLSKKRPTSRNRRKRCLAICRVTQKVSHYQ